MTTAREDTCRLADLLRRERHALAEFLVALSVFDRDRRWAELRHASLFSFLRRELGLSAGAAQYRKTAAELVQKYPEVEAALRDGRLCCRPRSSSRRCSRPRTRRRSFPGSSGSPAETPPSSPRRSARSRTRPGATSS